MALLYYNFVKERGYKKLGIKKEKHILIMSLFWHDAVDGHLHCWHLPGDFQVARQPHKTALSQRWQWYLSNLFCNN